MTRKLGLLAITFALLGGCSFHASAHAGVRSQNQATESTRESEAANREHRARDQQRAAHDNEKVSPETQSRALAEAPRREQAQPQPPAQGATVRDHDRGHGNDADGIDEDNPGKSKSVARAGKKGDHDRGHGNDDDGVDEDNPGKSRGKR